jgi:hypothetical protein
LSRRDSAQAGTRDERHQAHQHSGMTRQVVHGFLLWALSVQRLN